MFSSVKALYLSSDYRLPTDDLQGWQDAVLKALERKHRSEQEFLMTLLQDEGNQDLREEARGVSEDDRLKRLHELKQKRDELDFGVKGALFQMFFEFKVCSRLKSTVGTITDT